MGMRYTNSIRPFMLFYSEIKSLTKLRVFVNEIMFIDLRPKNKYGFLRKSTLGYSLGTISLYGEQPILCQLLSKILSTSITSSIQ